MLVLSRRAGEQLHIGDDVVITILETSKDGGIRVGIDAPRHLRVLRGELVEQVSHANTQAASADEAALVAALATTPREG